MSADPMKPVEISLPDSTSIVIHSIDNITFNYGVDEFQTSKQVTPQEAIEKIIYLNNVAQEHWPGNYLFEPTWQENKQVGSI